MEHNRHRQGNRELSRAYVARRIRLATASYALVAVLGTAAVGGLVATEIPGTASASTTTAKSTKSATSTTTAATTTTTVAPTSTSSAATTTSGAS